MTSTVVTSRALVTAALGGFAALASCVIPPPLNLDEPDAGPNHPPAIRVVRDGAGLELVRPGPLTFEVGAGEVRVTAFETDPGDTLYVRMYVDYGRNVETQFRVQCEAAPGATPTTERIITCPLLGLCTDELADTAVHDFEIDVLDRLPTSTAARLFRDVTPPGEIATFWWRLNCVMPS